MSDNDQHEGGPEWDRNQAAKLWAAATMAGDETQIELAANRMGDAVVNATTSRLIDGLIKTFKTEVAKITSERDARDHERDKVHTQRWEYTLQQLDQMLRRGDAQADLFGKLEELPKTIETLAREVATRLGKLERGQGRLNTKMRESQADRADLRTRSDEQHDMLVELLKRFNSFDATIADHEQRLTGLEDRDAASRES